MAWNQPGQIGGTAQSPIGGSSMGPRQLPYQQSQPPMGQPQGGAMGGFPGASGMQTSQPNPMMGGNAQPRQPMQGGGVQNNPMMSGGNSFMGMRPEMMQKLMEMIRMRQGGMRPPQPTYGSGGPNYDNTRMSTPESRMPQRPESPWKNEIGSGAIAPRDWYKGGITGPDGKPIDLSGNLDPWQNPNIGKGTGSKSRTSTDWLKRHPEEKKPDWWDNIQTVGPTDPNKMYGGPALSNPNRQIWM